jgi:hypothetical protein
MKTLLFSMLGLALLVNSGCSTFSIDKAQVDDTKKVAIAGFCVRQELPASLMGALMGETHGNAGFSAEMCSDKQHASTMYRDFAVSFRPEFKFTVLDQETVARNPKYAAFHQKYTDGWQSRPPSQGGQYKCYTAEGILDPFSFRKLSMEERADLMQSLGVDRIAVAEVTTNVENTNALKGMIGAADFATASRVSFQMYTATEKKPIWSDSNAKSDGAAGKVESVMGVHSQEALDQQAVTVSKAAYQSLSAHAKQ